MELYNNFLSFLPKLKESLTEKETVEWSIKGFIDTYKNIYAITTDTKVISKIIEIMIFPRLLEFAKDNNLKIELAPHQNYYPDVTFIDEKKRKYAVDLKTTYRINDDSVNGMTLGAFTGYFRNRTSKKNTLYPYSEYSNHYVLGVIYSRSDVDNITEMLKNNNINLKLTNRKSLINYMNDSSDENWFLFSRSYSDDVNKYRDKIDSYLVDELDSYNLENFKKITSVARKFELFFQEKWRLAVDKPGSGNTKNIGSEKNIKNLINGNGLFFREYGELGKLEFDKYWMQYLTKDMAKSLDQDKPNYSDIKSFKKWVISLNK